MDSSPLESPDVAPDSEPRERKEQCLAAKAKNVAPVGGAVNRPRGFPAMSCASAAGYTKGQVLEEARLFRAVEWTAIAPRAQDWLMAFVSRTAREQGLEVALAPPAQVCLR